MLVCSGISGLIIAFYRGMNTSVQDIADRDLKSTLLAFLGGFALFFSLVFCGHGSRTAPTDNCPFSPNAVGRCDALVSECLLLSLGCKSHSQAQSSNPLVSVADSAGHLVRKTFTPFAKMSYVISNCGETPSAWIRYSGVPELSFEAPYPMSQIAMNFPVLP